MRLKLLVSIEVYCTLSLIITVNQEIFWTYTWPVSFQQFDYMATGIK
jgi:hypothetical protein